MQSIRLGEYGIPITFFQTNDIDISAATITVLYTKPEGTEGEWAATITGTDFYYLLQEDDIDELGVWIVWVIAQWGDKLLWERVSFRVKPAPTSRIPA
ncbi:MAG: hypothetical protein GY853_01295 [PVC group bacterium]|nr:hypothetical protein [PVC group bacterium]